MSLLKESVKNANTALENWAKVIDFLQGAEGPGGEKFSQEAGVPGTRQGTIRSQLAGQGGVYENHPAAICGHTQARAR